MSSPIRISGLVVFAATLAVIVTTTVLLIDPIIGQSIRTAGSEMIGAKVELDEVETSFSEQRLTLSTLKVTDPRAPMKNLFEVSEIVVDLDADALLWNKVVVDELSITDFALNTPRDESGDYEPRWVEASQWNPMASVTGFGDMAVANLPDAEAVIEQESLQTPEAVEAFKTQLAQTKEQLTNDINALPDQSAIDAYRARVDAIKNNASGGNKLLGLLSQGKEIKQLRNDIKADLDNIKQLKAKFKTAQQEITQQYDALKKMPGKDWQRLKAKYALSGSGVEQIVSSLFGEQIGQWSQTAWHYYQMVSPYLNSYQPSTEADEVKVAQQITSRGRQVLFEDQNPLPNLLMKKINLSSELQDYGIALSGIIEHLTTEPDRWPEPTTLALEGNSSILDSFKINGTLDHRNPENSSDVLNLNATGVVLSALAQATDSEFVINEGEVDISADILRKGDQIDSTLDLNFSGLNITSELENDWQKQLLNAVNRLASLSVTVVLKGDINNPSVSIRSNDLNVIGAALVQTMASEEMAKFETQLQNAINDQTSGLLQEAGSLADISTLLEQLNLKESNLSDLLKLSR